MYLSRHFPCHVAAPFPEMYKTHSLLHTLHCIIAAHPHTHCGKSHFLSPFQDKLYHRVVTKQ